MTRRHVYPWLGALCLILPMPVLAGPGAGAGGGGGIGSGAVIEALWDWGEPAIEGARELKSGLIGEASPSLTLPGEVGVQVLVPNDLSLNRAYQVRLRGTLEDAQGKPLALNPVLGSWQPFDPRLEQVEATFTWSPAGLTKGDVGPLQATLIAEVALVTAGAGEVIIESEPFQVPIRLMLASALGEIKISEGGAIEEEDPSSPLYGARLEIPPGAFEGSGTLTAALLPATRLPHHEGYRAWLGQPAEVRLSHAEAPSAAMTLRLPTLGGEAPGMTYWDDEAQAYRFQPALEGGPGFVTVSAARATLWGPSAEAQEAYTFHLDLSASSAEPLETADCPEGCPEGVSSYIKADVRALIQGPMRVLSTSLVDEEGDDVWLDLEGDSEAGKCLETSWGARRLSPSGAVFAGEVALASLPIDTPVTCASGSGLLYPGANTLRLSNAQVPGWAEFVSWVVPPTPETLYSGTPPSTCSPETLSALEAYLNRNPTYQETAPGSGWDGETVTLAPLIFDCLWLRLDPSVDSAVATFDGDGRPTAIDATLPGALDAEQAAAFAEGTTGTLLRWRSGAEGAPTSPEEAEAQLLAACEAGSLPPSVGIIPLGAPTEVSGDALRFTLPSDTAWATGDEVAVSVLRLTQTGDGASSACVKVPWCIDADGDGFALNAWGEGERDCDDTNAAIHPGATEICNGADEDCDGTTDDDVKTTFYVDADQDGHGDADALDAEDGHVDDCSAPPGFVALNDDCDDAEAEVFPGAEERCDGVDQDCDKEIDEATGISLYRDQDGDGFGAGAPEARCSSEGWAALAGDCDDLDPARSPGAPGVPAFARDGSGPTYFNCGVTAPVPLIAFTGAAAEALWIPAGGPVQALIEEIMSLDAHLATHDLSDQFRAPDTLKLGPGTFLERLHVKGIGLRIEGTASPEGPLTVLDGQGSTCPSQSGVACSTLLVQESPGIYLRALELRGGAGTPYGILDPQAPTIMTTYGGGIAAIDSHLTLEDVAILDNWANVGAGLALIGAEGSLTLARSELSFNDTRFREGVPYGGALYLEGGSTRLFGALVRDNHHSSEAGEGRGAGLTAINVDLEVQSSRFEGQRAKSGAGVLVLSTDPGRSLSFENNTVLDNVASASGGGLLLVAAEGTPEGAWRLQGNLIAENSADFGVGGGISLTGALTFRNNLLSRNVAGLGGGGLSYMGDVPLQISQSIFEGNVQDPASATPMAPDLLFYGAGIHTDGSIFLPTAEEALSCGVSHGVSGAFGVEAPQPLGCATPASLGRLSPPAGATSPFVAYGPSLSQDRLDWHLLPGTLLDLGGLDTLPPGAEPSPARMQGQSAEGLGVYGGEAGGYGVGELIPECVGHESVIWWEGGPVFGRFDLTDGEARSGGGAAGPRDNLLFFGDAGAVLTVGVEGLRGLVDVEVLPVTEGSCAASQSLGLRSIMTGVLTDYALPSEGMYLLRVVPLEDPRGAYEVEITLDPL